MTARRKPQPSALRLRAEAAEEALEAARNEAESLGRMLGNTQHELSQTKAALDQAKTSTHEYRQRWREVEAKLDTDKRTHYRIEFHKRSIGWTASLHEDGNTVAYCGRLDTFWSFTRKGAGKAAAYDAFRRRYRASKPVDHGPGVKL